MDYATLFLVAVPGAFAMTFFLWSLLGKKGAVSWMRIIVASVLAGLSQFTVYALTRPEWWYAFLQFSVFYLSVLFVFRLRPFEALVGSIITFIATTFLQALSLSMLPPILGIPLSMVSADLVSKFFMGFFLTAGLFLFSILFLLNAVRLKYVRDLVKSWLTKGKNRFLVLLLLFTLLIIGTNIFIILQNYDLLVTNGTDPILIIVNFSLIFGFSIVSIFAFIGTVHGIEERERAERALRENERKLYMAQKMESLGRVAGWIAHDFNNLLTPVFGSIALLLIDDRLDDEQKRRIEDIRESTKKAAGLTKELLAYSRRKPGTFELLDPRELLETFHGVLSMIAGGRASFSLTMDAELPMMYADRSRIEQVLLNLVSNARDAIRDDGKITLEAGRVSATEVPGSEGKKFEEYLKIIVNDNGIGMDETTLSRIFEPFFTLKERGRGTGLGLSIVQEIVNQHKGHITVKSSPGSGSSFTIYIPARPRKT